MYYKCNSIQVHTSVSLRQFLAAQERNIIGARGFCTLSIEFRLLFFFKTKEKKKNSISHQLHPSSTHGLVLEQEEIHSCVSKTSQGQLQNSRRCQKKKKRQNSLSMPFSGNHDRSLGQDLKIRAVGRETHGHLDQSYTSITHMFLALRRGTVLEPRY